ncbi:MAG: SGNH/GDSL hydrolase family protein [bacterium]
MMQRYLKYSLFAILIAVYALFFAEGFLRAFAPQAFVPRNVTGSELGIRVNTPNSVYKQTTPEVKASITINSQGMRADHDYTIDKNEHRLRIALFGDSYFMGYEASIEDSFAGQLENGLRAKGCNAEVLNFAVSGYGTSEMLIMLQKRGLSFSPDIVIFQWHHTDPDDNIRSNLFQLKKGKLIRTGNDYLPAVSARQKLFRNAAYRYISSHSHLYAFSREKIALLIKRSLVSYQNFWQQDKPKKLSQPETQQPHKLDIALLTAAEKASRAHQASFYVVDIPSRRARTKFASSFRLLPTEMTSRDNYISPLSAFQKAADPAVKLYREKGHFHLTPLGNQLLAETVMAQLLEDPKTHSFCSLKN